MGIGTIVDLILVGVLLIVVITGAIKGFLKQLTGLVSGIFSVALAMILTSTLLSALRGTGLFTSFCATTSGWFSGNVFTTEAASQEDLATIMSQSGGWAICAGLAPSFYSEMSQLGYTTFGQLMGYYAANAIGYVAVWVLLFILIKICVKLLDKTLQKIARLPIINTIDRILGVFWAIAVVYVVAVVIVLTGAEIVVIKFASGSLEDFCAFLQKSKLLTIANNTNYLGMTLAQYVNVTLPTL